MVQLNRGFRTHTSLAKTLTFGLAALGAIASAAAQAPGAPALCGAQSPAHRVALLELYTSEGCDSCPPADQWLGGLAQQFKPQQAVSLAFHVDYWDYIGWKDRFAAPAYGARHSALVHSAGKKTVYTPQIFANGRELTAWRSPAQVQASVAELNRQTAPIQLRLAQTAAHQLQLSWSPPATGPALQLYIAVIEDGLVSHVTRGENKGATLRHASVVRAWHGPYSSQQASIVQTVQLPSDAVQSKLRSIAFAQDPRSAEVMQAVSLASCAAL